MSAITKMLKPHLGSLEELYAVVGRIQIASNASVTSEDIVGASVTKTGTGLYTITFDASAKPQAVRNVHCQLLSATAVNLAIQMVSASSTAVVVRLHAAGVATDPIAACELMVHIDCRKTGVTR
jgi:hypothetical protein